MQRGSGVRVCEKEDSVRMRTRKMTVDAYADSVREEGYSTKLVFFNTDCVFGVIIRYCTVSTSVSLCVPSCVVDEIFAADLETADVEPSVSMSTYIVWASDAPTAQHRGLRDVTVS